MAPALRGHLLCFHTQIGLLLKLCFASQTYGWDLAKDRCPKLSLAVGVLASQHTALHREGASPDSLLPPRAGILVGIHFSDQRITNGLLTTKREYLLFPKTPPPHLPTATTQYTPMIHLYVCDHISQEYANTPAVTQACSPHRVGADQL